MRLVCVERWEIYHFRSPSASGGLTLTFSLRSLIRLALPDPPFPAPVPINPMVSSNPVSAVRFPLELELLALLLPLDHPLALCLGVSANAG